MQDLADGAGISRAWLSEIENGKASPSVDVVRNLANALGVPVGSLLDGRAARLSFDSDIQQQEYKVIRGGDRLSLRLPSQPFTWEVLTPLKGEIQMMITKIPPNHEHVELMEHGGQECCLILEGRLEVVLNDEVVVLEKADTISFSAHLAHGFRNPGPDATLVLNVTSPPSLGQH
jgi:transcriptional regulator with XRE-family HTH domain